MLETLQNRKVPRVSTSRLPPRNRHTQQPLAFARSSGVMKGQSGGTLGADISAEEAWDVTTGSSNVIVGVVNTGIEYTYPDLIDNKRINPGEIFDDGINNDGNGYIDDYCGWEFYYGDDGPMDYRSHGTHEAGTIRAMANHAAGVTGVNRDVSLMALKISSDNPVATASHRQLPRPRSFTSRICAPHTVITFA